MSDKIPSNLPIIGNDAQDRMLEVIQRFDSSFKFQDLFQVLNYPYATDYELLLHYLRGAAGPFVDIKCYADVGVGFTLKPVGFKDMAEGDDAKEKAETFLNDIHFNTTMDIFAHWLEIIAKACIIETKDGLGQYYQNPQLGVTGVDAINPTSLTEASIQDVLQDPTGTKMYIQNPALSFNTSAPQFSQDRVIYRTQSSLFTRSVHGSSKLQRCVTDLRTASFFPHYRRDLGRIYSQLSRIITIDTEKLKGIDAMDAIMKTPETMQGYADQTADFYRQQEEKGGTFVKFDWESVDQSSFAGKEVKMVELEMQTYESIGRQVGVPLALVMSAAATNINRATLDAITTLFVSTQEKGTRNHIYTPIIERISNNYINSLGITGGHLEVEYNPFLPKDMLIVGEIIKALWPTGAISRPDVRQMADMQNAPYMGGEEWEELAKQGIDPMARPEQSTNNSYYISNPQKIDKDWNLLKSALLEKGFIKMV